MPNPINKVVFTEEQHQFLRDNYKTMTNQQLADALGLKLTRTRQEIYNLGLKRMVLQIWTPEQVEFLKNNYRRIGDKEIASIFNKQHLKNKKWSRSQIQKKLNQMGCKRNKLDLFLIKERNRKNGSYGKINKKNNPKPPKIYFQLDARTKIIVTPQTNVDKLLEKYQNRNSI
jgi:hypothetical protein